MQSSPKHNPVPTEQRENRADANPNRPLTGSGFEKICPETCACDISFSLQKRPSKLQANGPHYRS